MDATAAPRRAATTGLALVTVATACGASGTALALRVAALAPATPTARPDDLVELAVSAVGAVVLAWLAVSAAVAASCLVLRAAGRTWGRGEAAVHRFAPVLVRRALAIAVATGLGVSGTGVAMAEDGAPSPGDAATVTVTADVGPDLGWVVTSRATAGTPATDAPTAPATASPTPVASPSGSAAPAASPTATASPSSVADSTAPSTTGASSAAAAPRADRSEAATGGASGTSMATPRPAPAAPGAPGAPGTVTVRAGDTLWAIAARHLGPGAPDARIAAAWPAWYAANAALLGPDPDLILPGQVLTVPAGVSR